MLNGYPSIMAILIVYRSPIMFWYTEKYAWFVQHVQNDLNFYVVAKYFCSIFEFEFLSHSWLCAPQTCVAILLMLHETISWISDS